MVRPEDLAAMLIARHRAERQRHAARAGELRVTIERAIAAALPAGAHAWLIGSLAWAGFGAHSDVDVVVAGLDAEAVTRLGASLLARAGIPVDLLRLEDLPDPFRRRVVAEGVRVGEP